ncbi:hypothetical protein E0Z10_g7587 [Xylaria hypoxylon]|uniref:Uncharacterized protein n=1 Tax=Xylaria hypoxylon TaxID=37992 RepID=A0A4Z0YXQ4_9PEZI|nr:hypothetical protein E0Z10_g7587 [Xylaria hypoxylon]
MSQLYYYLPYLPNFGENWAIDIFRWFLAAKVPLPVLVGVPAAILVAINSKLIFNVFVRYTEMSADLMMKLSLFLMFLPFTALLVIRDLFFGIHVLDSPIPLWILDFLRGFRTGLGRCLAVFSRDLDDDDDDDDDDDAAEAAPPARGQYYPAPNDRTRRTPRSLSQEIDSWEPSVERVLPVLAFCVFVLFLLFVVCKLCSFFDEDGWCATSDVCGGPNASGEFSCLWYNENVIRKASLIAKKPLRYRFFYNGTRIQLPDR